MNKLLLLYMIWILSIVDKTYKRDFIDNIKSRDAYKLRKGIKISENLYLETNLNTEAKLNIIRFLLNEFDIELNEVIFSIK